MTMDRLICLDVSRSRRRNFARSRRTPAALPQVGPGQATVPFRNLRRGPDIAEISSQHMTCALLMPQSVC
jgi:hypothetical protein